MYVKCTNNWYNVDILKWGNECLYLTVINILTFALKWTEFLIRNPQFLEKVDLVEWMPNKLIGEVTQSHRGVQETFLALFAYTLLVLSNIFSKGLSSFPLYEQSSYRPA